MYTALRMIRSHRRPLTVKVLIRAVRWDAAYWINRFEKTVTE